MAKKNHAHKKETWRSKQNQKKLWFSGILNKKENTSKSNENTRAKLLRIKVLRQESFNKRERERERARAQQTKQPFKG